MTLASLMPFLFHFDGVSLLFLALDLILGKIAFASSAIFLKL